MWLFECSKGERHVVRVCDAAIYVRGRISPERKSRRRRADDYYTDLASFSVVERLTAVKNHFFFIVASSHSDLKS